MERDTSFHTQADTLRSLLASKLGLRRGSLARRIANAGRRLPPGIRNDIATLAEAEAMAQNPRLAAKVDPEATRPAFERSAAFLRAIDVADRRKGLLLSILGSVAFNILAVIALLIIVLRWRGLI